ncbi:uncharacterized protein LOC126884721 [Diabrotica virgifera virgifera]|uniref:Uncharacterized protein n=1 Tax=Diabrotica virgifera virgifera TaxID=50390 RepID=A0ABM5K9E0_DIAVI|nr:uncharacterized protein LOC126884721 [Diabrotica virgifera virgifera]
MEDTNNEEYVDPWWGEYLERRRIYDLIEDTLSFKIITDDYVKLLLCSAISLADIYLVTRIWRNRHLRCTKANEYILHYIICNLLLTAFLVIKISIEVLLILSQKERIKSRENFFRSYNSCIEKQLETTALLCFFLCAFGLTLDWLITVPFKLIRPLFQKIINNLILMIYGIALMKIYFDVICPSKNVKWMKVATQVLCISIAIFVLLCNFKRKSIYKERNYSLTIASVMVCCCVPFSIYVLVIELIMIDKDMFSFVLYITYFIPQYLAYTSSIISVAWLAIIKKKFRDALKIRCHDHIGNYYTDCEYCSAWNIDQSVDKVKESIAEEEQEVDIAPSKQPT